jgi:hypothetical protein
MKDNFDLKKFLKESKAIENLNPTFKSINEGIFGGKGNEKLKKEIFELAKWFMDSKNHNLLRLGELLNGETYPNILKMEDEIKSEDSKAHKRFTILLKDLQTIYNQEIKRNFPEGDPNSMDAKNTKLIDDFSVVALYLHRVFSHLFPTKDIDRAELAKLLKVDHLQSTKENTLKEKIREMIINELSEADGTDDITLNRGGGAAQDIDGKDPYDFLSESDDLHEKDESGLADAAIEDIKKKGKDSEWIKNLPAGMAAKLLKKVEDEKNLKEAKKDEEGEDQEEEYVGDDERYEFEKGKEAGEEEGEGGIEAIAADLDGTESDLMGNLMNALKIAKGMDNEKLEVQIGNTLKFFVSTYIDKEENER